VRGKDRGDIKRYEIKLVSLAAPDYWDFPITPHETCLLTDDGSLTTTKVAQCLLGRGWQVVVLSFPTSLISQRPSLPTTVRRVVLDNLSEEHLQEQLTEIVKTYGSITTFIHLHPVSEQLCPETINLIKPNKAILKQVFLLAKHLKSSLTEVDRGRSCFMTLVRMDGKFGLSKQENFNATSGGLFGLTKTLNLEWPSVFCRSLDISPQIDAATTAQIVLAELYDPNALIQEVSYTTKGRFTLTSKLASLVV
jgi:hypothetical protein